MYFVSINSYSVPINLRYTGRNQNAEIHGKFFIHLDFTEKGKSPERIKFWVRIRAEFRLRFIGLVRVKISPRNVGILVVSQFSHYKLVFY